MQSEADWRNKKLEEMENTALKVKKKHEEELSQKNEALTELIKAKDDALRNISEISQSEKKYKGRVKQLKDEMTEIKRR